MTPGDKSLVLDDWFVEPSCYPQRRKRGRSSRVWPTNLLTPAIGYGPGPPQDGLPETMLGRPISKAGYRRKESGESVIDRLLDTWEKPYPFHILVVSIGVADAVMCLVSLCCHGPSQDPATDPMSRGPVWCSGRSVGRTCRL